jgi:methylmalonyl-CoA mutase cobalamin-binding subunit
MLRDVHKHALLVALIPAVLIAASSLAQVSPEKEAREVFQKLVSVAGVSSHEEKVQEAIRGLLPKGVKPQVDDMNNLVVVLGSGKPELMFVARAKFTG